jgi:hypothetical protein
VGGWLGKEFLHRDALSADQQLAVGLELSGKGGHARERFAPGSALDLHRHGQHALLQNEVHLLIAFAPVGDLDIGAEAGIEQMRAEAGFD